jgi:acyl-CoA synthetase (AMP-forming)/AMP-acid ligase II
MAVHQTRRNSYRRNIASTLKATIVLLGLASIGYVVVVLAEHSAPSLLNAVSQSALESQMVSSEPSVKTLASQPGVATAGVPSAAVTAPAAGPDVEYFPSRFVNPATKIEDPIATF